MLSECEKIESSVSSYENDGLVIDRHRLIELELK